MDTTKPLHPITSGVIVLAGVKASNFADDIRNHPQVIMWDSQNEHWSGKDLPDNTRAVFVTRWIGHAAFGKLLTQARKRKITMFNPEGTGQIARQVRELLNLNRITQPTIEQITEEINFMATEKKMGGMGFKKLHELHPFIDYSKSNVQNAEVLMVKAKELGITSTLASLANMVGVQRKRHGLSSSKVARIKSSVVVNKVAVKKVEKDVSIEMIDGIITELKDIRAYLLETVAENQKLRVKVDKFRKFFDE